MGFGASWGNNNGSARGRVKRDPSQEDSEFFCGVGIADLVDKGFLPDAAGAQCLTSTWTSGTALTGGVTIVLVSFMAAMASS